MLYLLILSLLAPLERTSWSEMKTVFTIEAAEPDTTEVMESDTTEVEDESS